MSISNVQNIMLPIYVKHFHIILDTGDIMIKFERHLKVEKQLHGFILDW